MSKVLIIGSGLGGLTCGYILQKNGFDVTVLEQGVQVGGCLQCFHRNGAKFETGMHFIGSAAPGQTMNRLFRYFGLDGSVRLSPLDADGYNTISIGGGDFRFPNGRDALSERLVSCFPAEKDAIYRYMDIVSDIAGASTLESLVSPSRDIALNAEYESRSINDVLDSVFKDEQLKNILVGDLPLYSAVKDRTPFSLHAFIMDFYNQSAFRVVGGSDVIAHTLVSNIEGLGGRVLTRKKVVGIDCSDTLAIGVRTEDEEFYPADYVISTVHPRRTLEMLDTHLIRPAYRERIASLPQTSAVFAVYLKFKEKSVRYMNTNHFAYMGDFPWGCEDYTDDQWPKSYLYMHMCNGQDAVWAESGVVLAYMKFEDVERWKGYGAGRRGEDYEEFKRVHAERLMAAVEREHPGFRDTVESYWTSTPLTYLDYTGTEDGSMYGIAKNVNAGPAGRVAYRTRIPNLLLAGQNVNSHGIQGVIVGTLVTCAELVPADRIYSQIFG